MSFRGPRPWLLAGLSGGLLALAFPGTGDQSWLAFMALVPLLVAVDGAGWRRGATLGVASGMIFWLVTIPWIGSTMVRYGEVPWPLAALVLLALAGYLALYTAAFASLVAGRRFTSGAAYVLAVASLWVALEFLRTHLFTGFPWNLLGHSQYRNLPLVQVAAVTGVYGVSFVVAASNAALARLVAAVGWRDRLSSMSTAAAIGGLAVATGWSFPPGEVGTPAVRVAIVQGNIDQGVKWDPAYQTETLRAYQRLTEEAARQAPELIIWPETAVPFFLLADPWWNEITELARRSGTPLIVGAPDHSLDEPRNSALLIGPDGGLHGRYDKRHLVPFAEYVPLARLLFFVDIVAGGAIGAFGPGSEATLLSTPGGRVAVVICYEAIFPGEVREFFKGGADVLVNLTNDAWFGRSAAPVQHLAAAVFRAVENRAYLVRAANTGISAVVAPDGRIVRASGLFTREVLSGMVTRRATTSPYTRHGDLFAWATVGLSLAAAWPITRETRRRTRWLKRIQSAREAVDGRLPLRRGALALLGAGAAAVAVAVWGWRPQAADGRGYQEVARWRIPGGGEGRFIAVGPEVGSAGLRALGDQLRKEFLRADTVVVMIFDDPGAAREARRGSRVIGEERFQAALRHQRAMYVKQRGRGEHRLVIYEEGKYPTPGEVLEYEYQTDARVPTR